MNLEPARARSQIGQTILGAAWSRQNTLSVLEFLLIYGGDPDGITYSGYTPIQLAIVFGQREHAKVLLDRGASPLKSSVDFDAPNAFYLSKEIPWVNEMLKQHASGKRGG